MDAKEAAKVLLAELEHIENHGYILCSGPTAQTVRAALHAAVAALEAVDTITERARELIGLHMSEQEGMMIPTAQQFQDAIDALAQAIGARDQQPNQHQADRTSRKEPHHDA